MSTTSYRQCNPNFFDTINSQEKAYWLGFLYADGSLSAARTVIDSSLQAQDKPHLVTFAQMFGEEVKPHHKTLKDGRVIEGYRVCFSNPQLHGALLRLGVRPRKTYDTTFEVLEHVPEELHNHFLRGYFDGDGLLTLSGPANNKTLYFGLAGNLVSYIKRVGVERGARCASN